MSHPEFRFDTIAMTSLAQLPISPSTATHCINVSQLFKGRFQHRGVTCKTMTNASTRSPKHLPERFIVYEKPGHKGYQYQQALAGGSGRSLGTATNEETHLIW